MCDADLEDADNIAPEQKPAVGSRTPSASTPDSARAAANVFVQVSLLRNESWLKAENLQGMDASSVHV